MPVSRVNGVEIYWDRRTPPQGAGAAPRVLFIGGTGGDLRKTPNVFDGPLPRHADTLAYDQRGLGRSASPPGTWTMADYADDAAALLDAVGWDSAHVIGVSFGGMVAQHLAIRHPARIQRLVLCCTSPGGRGGSSWPLHELAGMDPEARLRFLAPISDTRHDAAWQAAHADAFNAAIRAQLAAEAAFADEPGRQDGARRQLEARRHHDAWDDLPGVPHETLICGGRYDGIATPEIQWRLAQRLPRARLRMYEGGHLFLLQDRGAWSDIIAFLTATPEQPARP